MKEVGTSLSVYPSFFVFDLYVSESIRNFAPISVMVSVVSVGYVSKRGIPTDLRNFRDYSVTRLIADKPKMAHSRAFAVMSVQLHSNCKGKSL